MLRCFASHLHKLYRAVNRVGSQRGFPMSFTVIKCRRLAASLFTGSHRLKMSCRAIHKKLEDFHRPRLATRHITCFHCPPLAIRSVRYSYAERMKSPQLAIDHGQSTFQAIILPLFFLRMPIRDKKKPSFAPYHRH